MVKLELTREELEILQAVLNIYIQDTETNDQGQEGWSTWQEHEFQETKVLYDKIRSY